MKAAPTLFSSQTRRATPANIASDSSRNRTAKRLHDPTLSNRAFAIFFVVTILIAVTLLLAPKARAATQYWDTSTSAGLQAGGTNWSTGGSGANLRWSDTTAGTTLKVWTNGNDAFFETSGTSVIGLNSTGITANSLTFDGAGYTIQAGAASTLTLVGSDSITTNADATISAILAGSVGLTKFGNSILTLSGTSANTYTGTTTVNAGELDLNKTAGLNAIPGNLTIGDGTGMDTVKLLANNQVADSSDVTINSSGVLNLNGKTETIDALNSSSTTASVTLGGGTLTVGANHETSATFAGVISGTGSLIKTGTGTQILSGPNTYGTVGVTGTTVNGGKLLVNNTTGSGTGVGNVLVNNTGTLCGTGTISGSVTVASGGIHNPGPAGAAGTAAAVGTLHTGALTLQSGSLSSFDVSAVTNYDQLISSGALTFGGTLDVNIASGLTFTAGDTLTLFTGPSTSNTFSGIADGQNVIYDGYLFTTDYTPTGFDLVAVPEPSTWICGALVAGLIGWSQRRRFVRRISRAV